MVGSANNRREDGLDDWIPCLVQSYLPNLRDSERRHSLMPLYIQNPVPSLIRLQLAVVELGSKYVAIKSGLHEIAWHRVALQLGYRIKPIKSSHHKPHVQSEI